MRNHSMPDGDATAPAKQPLPPRRGQLGGLRWLIAPSRRVTQPEVRRNSRLLAALVGGLTAVNGAMVIALWLTVPSYSLAPLVELGFVALAAAYALARLGHYQLAAGAAACLFPTVIFPLVLAGQVSQPNTTLTFLLLGPLLASIFLRRRWVTGLSALNVLGIAGLRWAPPPGLDTADMLRLLGLHVTTGLLIWALLSHRDALELDRQRGLKAAEAQLRQLVETTAAATIIEQDGVVRFANRAAGKLTGQEPAALTGRRVDDLLELVEESPFSARRLPDSERPGTRRSFARVRTRRERAWAELVEAPIQFEAAACQLITAFDVTDRVRSQQLVEHAATHDSLTGLPNRTVFQDRLDVALRRSRRSGAGMAVLFIDVDDFKGINDRWGHQAGDMVLATIAGRLLAALRDSDTVARLGGDEFGAVLEGLPDEAVTAALVERVLRAVAMPVTLASGGVVTPTTSIGVGVFPLHGATLDELLKAADDAMYVAKRAGKARWQMAEESAQEPEAPSRQSLRSMG